MPRAVWHLHSINDMRLVPVCRGYAHFRRYVILFLTFGLLLLLLLANIHVVLRKIFGHHRHRKGLKTPHSQISPHGPGKHSQAHGHRDVTTPRHAVMARDVTSSDVLTTTDSTEDGGLPFSYTVTNQKIDGFKVVSQFSSKFLR